MVERLLYWLWDTAKGLELAKHSSDCFGLVREQWPRGPVPVSKPAVSVVALFALLPGYHQQTILFFTCIHLDMPGLEPLSHRWKTSKITRQIKPVLFLNCECQVFLSQQQKADSPTYYVLLLYFINFSSNFYYFFSFTGLEFGLFSFA